MRKANNLPPSCAGCQEIWGLNFLGPCGLFQACNGAAFTLGSKTVNLKEVITIIMNVNMEFIVRAQKFGFRFW